jgi:hypothetical protein
MSLITYMHEEWGWANAPRWYVPSPHFEMTFCHPPGHNQLIIFRQNRVRATYTTPDRGLRLPSGFLSSGDAPSSAHDTSPPIYHVTATNFAPTLFEGDLEKIENMTVRGPGNERATDDKAGKAREHVLGDKAGKPSVSGMWMEKNSRSCGYYEEFKDKLQQCARLVFRNERDPCADEISGARWYIIVAKNGESKWRICSHDKY